MARTVTTIHGARAGSLTQLLLVAMLLAACSGAGSDGDSATDAGTTPDPPGEDQAQDGGDAAPAPLEGETIDFVVPYEPGGGYDVYVRSIAPYFEECSGATVVVLNEPGAGGLRATTQTFAAPPDSLRIQIINTVGVVSAQLGEAEGATFDASEFSWLGRVSAEPNVLVVGTDSEIGSFEDILNAEEPVRFVATGPGSNEYVNSSILPEIYDFPAEVITGFEGSGEARAAVLSGDADAHILPLDSQIDAIQAGDVRPVLVIGQEPNEAVPDTPTIADYPVEGEEQQGVLDALIDLVESGRSVAAPPGLDAGQLAALRDGLACALGNEDLLEQAEQQQRVIDPLSGEEMNELVDTVLDAPPTFQQLVREAS
ncbi:MAG: hypothetical protein GEU81_18185 [Nitriliruptorales bacterium]|nr:hypothetical protein [Nitriliruptorales bacterium]